MGLFLPRGNDLPLSDHWVREKNITKIMPHLAPGHLFLLGRSTASKIIYVKPVGGPGKHFKYWENSNTEI